MLQTQLTFFIDLLAFFGVFTIITISLNIEFGYAGIPNFGKLLAVLGGALFIGAVPGRILAYIYGVMDNLDFIDSNTLIMSKVNGILSKDLFSSIIVLILSLILAALIGAMLGAIASYPAIRLREDYLAIILLAMAEILRTIGENYEPLAGGTLGVIVPDPFRWVGGKYRIIMATCCILIVAVLVFIYAESLSRSPLGRVLRAIRDNEISAEVFGKDVVKLRMKTLMLGSAMAALSGALMSFYSASTGALMYERVTYTFWPWVMVVIGGAANNFGVLLGTFLFVFLRKLIIFYKDIFDPYVPFDVNWLVYLFLGLALIFVLIYRPEGIIPEKPSRTLSRRELDQIMRETKLKTAK